MVVRSENSGQLLELSGSFTPEDATIMLRTLTFANGTFTRTARVEVDIEFQKGGRGRGGERSFE